MYLTTMIPLYVLAGVAQIVSMGHNTLQAGHLCLTMNASEAYLSAAVEKKASQESCGVVMAVELRMFQSYGQICPVD